MKRCIKLITIAMGTFLFPMIAGAQAADTDTEMSKIHQPYNAFLSKYVVPENGLNLVAYGKVTDADEQALEDYIDTLSTIDIATYSDDQAMAYWFNLYNAKTVDLILDNYPVKSIRKIGFLSGPWDKDILTVRGQKMSLNDIEHDTVRERYKEPRVHFAFNCASIGCPNLKTTAWEAATLNEDLTQAAKDYIASPRGVRVDEDGDITVSSIFKWYQEDFGENEADVMTYLIKFADGDKKLVLQNANEIDDYDYDWSLNIAE